MRPVKLVLVGPAALAIALVALVTADLDAHAGAAKPATAAQRSSAAPPAALDARRAAPLATFYRLLDKDEKAARVALREISWSWQPSYAAILIQMMGWIEHRNVHADAIALLERASGRTFGKDANAMYEWLWSFDPGQHPDYSEFLATFFVDVDPRFREYFADRPKTVIRLDEIRWGGVRRDGIPPLKNPKMIRASEATYLDDDNIIFGVAINGDVRAYPKRILAWHEMVKDKIGGLEINGVYCTLCGSMIVYDATVNGVHHELGTSGFLYRSNKMMYDQATKSLWSTLSGTPVVGSLVGRGIELKTLYVVTTTWKEWRRRHPNTLVLSLDTGHRRDYGDARPAWACAARCASIVRSAMNIARNESALTAKQGAIPTSAMIVPAGGGAEDARAVHDDAVQGDRVHDAVGADDLDHERLPRRVVDRERPSRAPAPAPAPSTARPRPSRRARTASTPGPPSRAA